MENSAIQKQSTTTTHTHTPWSFAEESIKLISHDSRDIMKVTLECFVHDLVLSHQNVVLIAKLLKVGAGLVHCLTGQLLYTESDNKETMASPQTTDHGITTNMRS